MRLRDYRRIFWTGDGELGFIWSCGDIGGLEVSFLVIKFRRFLCADL